MAISATAQSSIRYSTNPSQVESPQAAVSKHDKPSSPRFSVGVTGGTLGTGLELTGSINRHLAVRAAGHYLSLGVDFTTNQIPFHTSAQLRSASVQLDYAPRGGNFRISPGILALNNQQLAAHGVVAAGQTFDLGDGTYTSQASDPVHADAAIRMGDNARPMLTLGWSSVLPHKWRFTMPVELGVVYIGKPTLVLNFAGEVCDSSHNCSEIATDPDAQANLQHERNTWQSNLNDFQAYPVVSIGFGYRFGPSVR